MFVLRNSSEYLYMINFNNLSIIRQKDYHTKSLSFKMADVLLPREASKYIAENSKHVSICSSGVQSTAKKMLELLQNNPASLNVQRWNLHELNPKGKNQHAVDWVFVADVLNFSFWSDDENNKYKVTYNGKSWTGYWSLCAAINRAIDEGIPILDPSYYGQINMEQLNAIFRSDNEVTMPLMEFRLKNLHEAGKVLTEKYGGTFLNVVKSADMSAQKLLQIVTKEFPSFRDEALFAGKKVGLYKRAQILIGDIWAACGGTGHSTFHDIDTITMFADYRIPQALLWFGVLKYTDELMGKLKNNVMFESGDTEEVEIRGCSIWAVELIVEALNILIAADSDSAGSTHMNAILLDHYLWDYRREHAEATSHIPIHKTRCIYY